MLGVSNPPGGQKAQHLTSGKRSFSLRAIRAAAPAPRLCPAWISRLMSRLVSRLISRLTSRLISILVSRLLSRLVSRQGLVDRDQ